MEYTEHEKLKLVSGESQTIGEFLEWANGQGWMLAEYPKDSSHLYPVAKGINAILAQRFDIDESRLEKEKRHMLNEIREVAGEENV